MGIIRFFLAYVVLLNHVPLGILPKFIHPSAAVQSFFIISGFYIQLLLRKKYSYSAESIKKFYASRFLRIYPLYWLTLLLFYVFFPIPAAFNYGDLLNKEYYGIFIYKFIANIFLIGLNRS